MNHVELICKMHLMLTDNCVLLGLHVFEYIEPALVGG